MIRSGQQTYSTRQFYLDILNDSFRTNTPNQTVPPGHPEGFVQDNKHTQPDSSIWTS